MPHTLLISDLHLSAQREGITRLLLRFLRDEASCADALYVLGDLFDFWLGDDDLDTPQHREIAAAFRALTDGGVKLYFMHGNRDFLLREEFAGACGATLIPDPVLVHLHGTPTLLTHGDLLCTDDRSYQAFRKKTRNPKLQWMFLALPLTLRKKTVRMVRNNSGKQYKPQSVMDVNDDAVAALLRAYHYPRLIHGHTHRPGCTLHHVDGHTCERWVLGDWGARGNALRCEDGKCWAMEFD